MKRRRNWVSGVLNALHIIGHAIMRQAMIRHVSSLGSGTGAMLHGVGTMAGQCIFNSLHTVHCGTITNPVNIRRHTRNPCASLVRVHPVTTPEIRTHMDTNTLTETTYIPTSGRTGFSLFVLVFAGSAGMTIQVSSDQAWPCSSRHRALIDTDNAVQHPRKPQFHRGRRQRQLKPPCTKGAAAHATTPSSRVSPTSAPASTGLPGAATGMPGAGRR